MALIAGASYLATRSLINQFPIPPGWSERPEYKVRDDQTGFKARAFQSGTDIVISYAGTYSKSGADIKADIDLGLGVGSAQLNQAVEYYLQVRSANPGASITLIGHSPGGGLAALAGVFAGHPGSGYS